MKNKILVEVYVPLIEREFDVFIPINKKIKNVTRLINEAIVDLSNGSWPSDKNVRLFSRNSGVYLDSKANVREAGLVNGSEVILLIV